VSIRISSSEQALTLMKSLRIEGSLPHEQREQLHRDADEILLQVLEMSDNPKHRDVAVAFREKRVAMRFWYA